MTNAPRYRRPHTSRSRWLMFGIPLLATAGGAILIGSLYLVSLSTMKNLPVTVRDRESLLTATDLQGEVAGFVLRTDAESLTKVQSHDGRVELAYRYDHPDKQSPLWLSCSLIIEPTRNGARLSFAERQTAASDAAAGFESGLIFEHRNDVYGRGDASEFAEVTKLGQPRGFFYACRHGEHIFSVLLLGHDLPNQERFLAMLEPYVEQFAAYEP